MILLSKRRGISPAPLIDMPCKYIALCADEQDEALYTTMCARPAEGDYCVEHKRRMAESDQLDRELQDIIRERTQRKK